MALTMFPLSSGPHPVRALACALTLLLALPACDVPEPPGATGGTTLPEGACGRGLVVVGSNYQASNVALTDLRGAVRSSTLLSSGTTATGLSTPLSGDVVAPTDRPASGDVVLLDRYPNAVLTWVDPASGRVQRQLSVATGFAANPQDYLEVSATRAYVPRLEPGPAPGSEPFDGGSDMLVIDPQKPAITGRIAFAAEPPYLPRPSRLTRVGDAAWLTLLRLNADYDAALDSVVVALDLATDTERGRLELTGLANCGNLARDPTGQLVAVTCSGVFADAPAAQLARSGVVLLDARSSPPRELLRVPGSALGQPPAFALPAFADASRLLVSLAGDADAGQTDALVVIDTTTGSVENIHISAAPFVLGDVRCATPCELRCLVADAAAPGLRALRVTPAAIALDSVADVARSLGLPPRFLGSF